MKKVASGFLAAVIFIIFSATAFATALEEQVLFTLKGYGVVSGDTASQPQVSRGEFAGMVTKLMGFADTEDSGSWTTAYWDVPETYEYAENISLLTQMGVLNGVSETMFHPYEMVTYEQAIKVLTVITGYGDIAERSGGWPGGYIAVAGKNGMLGGVSLSNPFARGDLYRLIYNAIDVPLVDDIFTTGEGSTSVKTDETLRDKLTSSAGDRLFKHAGVIIADAYTYTTTPYSDLSNDEVVIENKSVGGTYIYKIGKADVSDFIGCKVDFYAREIDGVYELLSVRLSAECDVVTVNASDINPKNGDSISYSNENGKTEKLSLDSNIRVVCNGSRVLSPDDNIFDFSDGYISFINNDADSSYDLAMIWKYENAVATEFDGQRFSFAPDALYGGMTALFVDSEDDTVKMVVTDKNGNTVESFTGERTVSIFANADKSRYRIIVSDEQIEGVLSSIGDEVLTVGESEYNAAASLKNMVLGENYLIYLDYEGKLAFAKSQNVVNYGYILKYGGNGSFVRKVSAKIILPKVVDAGVEVNEEDSTDTSSVPYLILQNSSAEIFDFAESVKCGSRKYSGDELLTLLAQPDMKAVSYELNEDGEIKEITPLEKHGGELTDRYQYNVYDRIFGGTTVAADSGFAINSVTKAVCVPADENNNILTDASDDDLGLRVNITVANNDVGYRVEGYDYDEANKKVRFLVTLASMDATLVQEVNVFSEKASMVTGVKYVLNAETGEMEQCIDVLGGSEAKSLKPIQITSSNSNITRLKKGDLICYTTNNNDLLENAFIIESIPKLNNEFVSETPSNSIKRTYGRTGNIIYDEVDTYNRRLITDIEVYIGDALQPRTFHIPQTNTPPVYVYNSGDGTVECVSLKDIRTSGEKIYVFERKGDSLVRAIVLVR